MTVRVIIIYDASRARKIWNESILFMSFQFFIFFIIDVMRQHFLAFTRFSYSLRSNFLFGLLFLTKFCGLFGVCRKSIKLFLRIKKIKKIIVYCSNPWQYSVAIIATTRPQKIIIMKNEKFIMKF